MKSAKARELNIPIITEEAFCEKFGLPTYAIYDFSKNNNNNNNFFDEYEYDLEEDNDEE